MHVLQESACQERLQGYKKPGASPDVGILVLVPHVLILLLPIKQQSLYFVHDVLNATCDLHHHT